MATTQKVYIGDNLIKRNYRGDNEVVSKWGNEFNQYDVDYLIVAGGGPSGGDNAGGGGAGGVITGSAYTLDWATEYTTIVGAGGGAEFTNGSPSSFLSLTALGGGFGASNAQSGSNGASGGGGAYFEASYPGGTGILGQGFDGGEGYSTLNPGGGAGGGGGGASEAGFNGVSGSAGDGGDGIQWLDGNYYGGGGAGSVPFGATLGTGGLGGGGNGGNKSALPDGNPGEVNTGGGGGAGFSVQPGGRGVIVVRYQSEYPLSESGDEMYRDGNYWYHRFTSATTSSFQFL
jgi:hypothetical protein